MKQITFYLDFVSPWAYLAFEQLPEVLRGISCHVQYRPVLAHALSHSEGVAGPAEAHAERQWQLRHLDWLAHRAGVPLQMPAVHPWNALPLLQLALECSRDGSTNRWVTETVLRHVWQGGDDALAQERLDTLQAQLASQRNNSQRHQQGADNTERWLSENSQAVAAQQVLGVPAWVVDGRWFWGLDSLPMLRACLQGDAWFEQHWDPAASVQSGLTQG